MRSANPVAPGGKQGKWKGTAVRSHTQQRSAVLSRIAATVTELHPNRVARVGVDGVDGAGKTTFADELAETIVTRPTIRVGLDGFHHPRSVRYRRGRHSPEGYFHDSYDYARLREMVLEPLSPGGGGRYGRAAFDYRTDRPIASGWQHAPSDAVLIVDGIFLHRPELRPYWDYTVFLQVDFTMSIRRCAARGDLDPDPGAPSNRRYVEGQRLYLDQCHPADQASIVIDNSDLGEPHITRQAGRGRPA